MSYFEYIRTIPTPYVILFVVAIILFFRLINEGILTFAQIFKKNSNETTSHNAVSIIVCARNEVQNLERNIPILCEQKYKTFEVVVVNDASEDNTETVLYQLKKQYKNLTITSIAKDPKFDHGKKLALTVGIKAAKYNMLLMIDADCWPESDEWLRGMASMLEHKDFVLGYGGYAKEKGLINRLIRFDTLQIAKTYIGMACLGMPYMGVGRNLAYKKSVYENAKGFSKHYHILSGDDDLLVNQMARRKNTAVNINAKTFTRSWAEKSIQNWVLQKRRHLSTGNKYRFSHKIYLTIDWGIRILTWPSIIIVFFLNNEHQSIAYFSVIGYIVTLLFLWKMVMRKYKEKGFLLLIPFFEIIITTLPFILILNSFLKKNNRNGYQ